MRARHGISWWRLILGVLLLRMGLKDLNHGRIAPELLPSNQTRWLGYNLATGMLIVLGLVLLLLSRRSVNPR
jgi:hypothetical protein